MYSQILCYVSERFFNIPNPTKLGRTELQEPEPREATEIMMLSTESRLNSSGTFSQDSQRCTFVIKSVIFWALWDKHQKLSQEEFSLCQCSMTSPVIRTATKMNVQRMPTFWRLLREDLVLGNGHLLDQVMRKSGILPRTVDKEPGTILRKKCCWNSQKADILSSVQRLHCPGVNWEAKDEENCRYTSVLIKIQLIQLIALFFLSISSVSTEQWQLYARNLRTIKIERGNLWYWWDNQLFLAKSKQKLLSTMKIPWMTKLFGSNTFNKLNRFHQKE